MQEVIKFELKGINATIRKPESNSTYFTYNNVHKIMLLGIFGAIIGENGYNYNNLFKEKCGELPEFYTKLEKLKIAVKPNSNDGTFIKKIQKFNNSVGYANINDSEPTTLIVSEQWLENPSWTIFILNDDSNEYLKLKDYLINKKCEYIPYIGKNDHFADISNVEILTVNKANNVTEINSIFTDIKYEPNSTYDDYVALMTTQDNKNSNDYLVKEVLPTKLNQNIGYTDFKEFIYTNKRIKIANNTENLYKIKEENIFFF